MLVLAENWWVFVLRGLFAIIFGVLTFLLPGMALLTLIYLFGIYTAADGILNIVAAFRRTRDGQAPWWALLLEGILSIAAGVVAFVLPGLTALALLFLIAGWAVATGVMEIAAAIRLRKQIRNEWVLALVGVLSIAFGVLLFIRPGPGALALIWWIGAYAIAFGVLLMVFGFRLRSLRHVSEPGAHGFPSVAPGH